MLQNDEIVRRAHSPLNESDSSSELRSQLSNLVVFDGEV